MVPRRRHRAQRLGAGARRLSRCARRARRTALLAGGRTRSPVVPPRGARLPRPTSAAVTIGYVRSGSGEPLLLVHGLGGVGSYWEPLLPRLTSCYDVVVVDLPGFGRSTPVPGAAVHPEALALALSGLL